MGIYTRYATAVLVLFTSSAFSATRVPVKPTSETVITGARTGAVSTPAGDVAFYGADKVYSFTAGDSVAPTVREVKSPVGSVSYPYGPGAAYPNDPAYSASAATKIKVKPVAVVPKTRITTSLKNVLKLNPMQLAASVGTAAALSAVGWVMEDGAKVNKPGQTIIAKKLPGTVDGLGVVFAGTGNPGCYGAAGFYDGGNGWDYIVSTGTPYQGNGFTYVSNCDPNFMSQRLHKDYTVSESSIAEVDYADFTSTLDPYISAQAAPWLASLLKDICSSSLSPSKCYEEMEDRSKRTLQGPATVAGPWFTKTSTFPKPDGTTGTKTETTSTKYDFTYGPEHFDVNPERKTTTTEDGLVTSETTETDGTPAEDVTDTPDEEAPPEDSYTFNDSDLPAVEPFYTQKYPDGFQGVWDSANTDFEQSAFVSFLNSFVPSFSGSCPAFSMSFAIGGVANLGTHGFGNLCYALDFVKVCIMLGALFLCRAIVFGG